MASASIVATSVSQVAAGVGGWLEERGLPDLEARIWWTLTFVLRMFISSGSCVRTCHESSSWPEVVVAAVVAVVVVVVVVVVVSTRALNVVSVGEAGVELQGEAEDVSGQECDDLFSSNTEQRPSQMPLTACGQEAEQLTPFSENLLEVMYFRKLKQK